MIARGRESLSDNFPYTPQGGKLDISHLGTLFSYIATLTVNKPSSKEIEETLDFTVLSRCCFDYHID